MGRQLKQNFLQFMYCKENSQLFIALNKID